MAQDDSALKRTKKIDPFNMMLKRTLPLLKKWQIT